MFPIEELSLRHGFVSLPLTTKKGLQAVNPKPNINQTRADGPSDALIEWNCGASKVEVGSFAQKNGDNMSLHALRSAAALAVLLFACFEGGTHIRVLFKRLWHVLKSVPLRRSRVILIVITIVIYTCPIWYYGLHVLDSA